MSKKKLIRDFIPFPDKPDASFAQGILSLAQPIIEGWREYQWKTKRDDLIHSRDPNFARDPKTGEFKSLVLETRMLLALAFHTLHGRKGLDFSLQRTDPQSFAFHKAMHDFDCKFHAWVEREVDLRAGAMPIPHDTRSWDFAERLFGPLSDALDDVDEGGVTLLTPRPPDIPMPRDNVLIQAVDWYTHIYRSITAGYYEHPGEEFLND